MSELLTSVQFSLGVPRIQSRILWRQGESSHDWKELSVTTLITQAIWMAMNTLSYGTLTWSRRLSLRMNSERSQVALCPLARNSEVKERRRTSCALQERPSLIIITTSFWALWRPSGSGAQRAAHSWRTTRPLANCNLSLRKPWCAFSYLCGKMRVNVLVGCRMQ